MCVECLFGSNFFWKVYKLLIEKQVLDDVDLEMVEYHLTSKRETLISSKVVFHRFYVFQRNCLVSFANPVLSESWNIISYNCNGWWFEIHCKILIRFSRCVQFLFYKYFQFLSCVSVIAAVIACWFYTSHSVWCILVFPALFIGLLKATEQFCYFIISFYISVSADFDSVFHRVVAAIRCREVTFFGYVNSIIYVIN